jgi:hypothetical protein
MMLWQPFGNATMLATRSIVVIGFGKSAGSAFTRPPETAKRSAVDVCMAERLFVVLVGVGQMGTRFVGRGRWRRLLQFAKFLANDYRGRRESPSFEAQHHFLETRGRVGFALAIPATLKAKFEVAGNLPKGDMFDRGRDQLVKPP